MVSFDLQRLAHGVVAPVKNAIQSDFDVGVLGHPRLIERVCPVKPSQVFELLLEDFEGIRKVSSRTEFKVPEGSV